jgi:glycosyltransferase involved in cell wall biosynthesis
MPDNYDPGVTVIFIAKNEEGTIQTAISTAKQSQFEPAILVVDAYSTDKAGAKVIQQPSQIFPGKGLAMRAGVKAVIDRTKAMTEDIILFLDADIRNLTPEWVDTLVQSLIDDNCDMSRGFYTRHARDAAVTKLIARPMLLIFFPELSHFEQPLSGEVCARAQVWESLLRINPIPDGWGIDVWFLIESAMLGYNIKVFMGSKEHTSFEDYKEDISKLSKMAEQVEFTILEKQ